MAHVHVHVHVGGMRAREGAFWSVSRCTLTLTLTLALTFWSVSRWCGASISIVGKTSR